MRQLSDTHAAAAEGPEVVETPFLNLSAASGLRLIGLRARKAISEWGPRAYVDVMLPAEAGTLFANSEYTISFTDRSRAYNQVLAWIKAELSGQPQFPVLFSVGPWGRKSFELVDAPEPTEENTLAALFRGNEARKNAADKAASNKAAADPSPFDESFEATAQAKVANLVNAKVGTPVQQALEGVKGVKGVSVPTERGLERGI